MEAKILEMKKRAIGEVPTRKQRSNELDEYAVLSNFRMMLVDVMDESSMSLALLP